MLWTCDSGGRDCRHSPTERQLRAAATGDQAENRPAATSWSSGRRATAGRPAWPRRRN